MTNIISQVGGLEGAMSKEELIVGHMYLVSHLVRKHFLWVPETMMSREDLESVGYIGLIDAADRWNPDHETKSTFKTFAYHRIIGQITDELRELYRIPGCQDSEIAQDLLKNVESGDHPFKILHTKELRQILEKAVDELPTTARTVIRLYYFYGISLSDIALMFSCTTCNIIAYKKRALEYLRVRLTGEGEVRHVFERTARIRTNIQSCGQLGNSYSRQLRENGGTERSAFQG
jgi:RNA polymerase sigma factor (sigma-70 family)